MTENETLLLQATINLYNRLCLTNLEIIEDLAIFTRKAVDDALEKGVTEPPKEVELEYIIFADELEYVRASQEELKREIDKKIKKFKIKDIDFKKEKFLFNEIRYINWEQARQIIIEHIEELLEKGKQTYEPRTNFKGPIN